MKYSDVNIAIYKTRKLPYISPAPSGEGGRGGLLLMPDYIGFSDLSVDDVLVLGTVQWKVHMVNKDGVWLKDVKRGDSWFLDEKEFTREPFKRLENDNGTETN